MNIYHCCAHKTGSQWIYSIFSDSRVVEISGLTPVYCSFPDLSVAFPDNSIISPIYTNFENFSILPKPSEYRAFYVLRDPRDIIVSWYFSIRYSHKLMGDISELRKKFNQMTVQEGLIFAIDHLNRRLSLYSALVSWLSASDQDDSVRIFRFEDLVGSDSLKTFADLFDHCQIAIERKSLKSVLDDYSFQKITQRSQGTENLYSHFRKGAPGDWINHFDDVVEQKFLEATQEFGNLPTLLGYADSKLDVLKQQLNKANYDLKQTQVRLQHLSGEFESANNSISAMLDSLEQQRVEFESRLRQTQTKLINSLGKIQKKKEQISNIRKQRNALLKKLQRVQGDLDQSRETIAVMQSSKFWKLRTRWTQLKIFLSQLFKVRKQEI